MSLHIITVINHGWALLDKYYNTVDETPVYHCAMALHPEMKLQWFREEWEECPNWISVAECAVQNHWSTEFQSKSQSSQASNHSTPSITITGAPNIIRNSTSKKHQHQQAETLDQFERFQDRDSEDEISAGVLQYWVSRLNDSCQSLLAQMGVELMSIPAISDEPEGVFSSAMLLLSDVRNCLGDDIIEASECLKSSVQQGLIFGATESDIVRMVQILQDLASQSG